jgi:hypothetical protein
MDNHTGTNAVTLRDNDPEFMPKHFSRLGLPLPMPLKKRKKKAMAKKKAKNRRTLIRDPKLIISDDEI